MTHSPCNSHCVFMLFQKQSGAWGTYPALPSKPITKKKSFVVIGTLTSLLGTRGNFHEMHQGIAPQKPTTWGIRQTLQTTSSSSSLAPGSNKGPIFSFEFRWKQTPFMAFMLIPFLHVWNTLQGQGAWNENSTPGGSEQENNNSALFEILTSQISAGAVDTKSTKAHFTPSKKNELKQQIASESCIRKQLMEFKAVEDFARCWDFCNGQVFSWAAQVEMHLSFDELHRYTCRKNRFKKVNGTSHGKSGEICRIPGSPQNLHPCLTHDPWNTLFTSILSL